MTHHSTPLVQKFSLDPPIALKVDPIEARYVGFLLKKGRFARTMPPGRYLNLAVPLRPRLSLIDQVIDVHQVVLELAEPLNTLTTAIRDPAASLVARAAVVPRPCPRATCPLLGAQQTEGVPQRYRQVMGLGSSNGTLIEGQRLQVRQPIATCIVGLSLAWGNRSGYSKAKISGFNSLGQAFECERE